MRVIQVGIGGMGNAWLRSVFAAAPDVEYAGFIEINEAIIDKQVGEHGLDRSRIFRSLEEALAVESADGVIVVTPPQFHRDVSIVALKAGVPVLSEKPLADTWESAADIARVARETGVLHLVSQNYRYRSPIHTLKQVLMAQSLGPISSVSVEFFRGPHFGGFREVMPDPLITDMAIHHFDLMRYLLDADPVSVFAKSWNPSWSWFSGDASASVVVEFPGQRVVTYDGSWCSRGTPTSWNGNWRFDCSDGVIALRDDQVILEREGASTEVIPAVPLEHENQAYVLREFYAAVVDGKIPLTTCHDNLKSLGIVFDALESVATGKVVQSGIRTGVA